MFRIHTSAESLKDTDHVYPITWRSFREGRFKKKQPEAPTSEMTGSLCIHTNGEVSGNLGHATTSEATVGYVEYTFRGARDGAATSFDDDALKQFKKKWKAVDDSIPPAEKTTLEHPILDEVLGCYSFVDLQNRGQQISVKTHGSGSKVYGFLKSATYCGWMILNTPKDELEIGTHIGFSWFGKKFAIKEKKTKRREKGFSDEQVSSNQFESSRGSLAFFASEEFDIEVFFAGGSGGMGSFKGIKKEKKSKIPKTWVYANGFKEIQEKWFLQKIESLRNSQMEALEGNVDMDNSSGLGNSGNSNNYRHLKRSGRNPEFAISASQFPEKLNDVEALNDLKEWVSIMGPEKLESLKELKDWEQSKSDIELGELVLLKQWAESVRELAEEKETEDGGGVQL